MSFLTELNDTIRGDTETYGTTASRFMQPTGFTCFDYLNGEIAYNGKNERLVHVGVDHGKIITVIGKSGSGKSTFAMQMGAQLIKPFKEGAIFVFDFEQGSSKERIKQITGMDEDYYNEHVTLLQKGISTESVLKLIMQIKKLKLEHEKELLVDNPNGEKDENGEVIKVLPPTVVVIDSIASMLPANELDEDIIKGQMTATGIAKVNTQLFKRIGMPCATANIIPIFINHINAKIETTIVPTQSQVNYLSQSETLPGGNACIYLTNTLIRITTKSKLEPDKGYQIKGFETAVSLVKSRSSAAGRSVTMVYNQFEGFDNDLSLLEYIKACGKLKGAGVSYKLEGLEDHTFRLSAFKDKLKEDTVLRNHFYKLGKELLEASIYESAKLKKMQDEEAESQKIDENIEAEKMAQTDIEVSEALETLSEPEQE